MVFVSTAGDAPLTESLQSCLLPGQICRIATGAPLPSGADGVVMVEVTQLIEACQETKEEKIVRILKPCERGQNIREIGSDVTKNEVVMEKGHVVSPADVGLLASIGRSEVL